MRGLNLEKHFALTSSNLIQQICGPVLNPIDITYFNYIKIYHNDCSRELLTNNPDWIDHFYKNALYDTVAAIDIEHLLPKGYFLWSEMDKTSPVYLQGRDFFNIDHGISFVIKRTDVTYLYIFGTKRENHEINNFYAGNIDLLQRFIHFFTDQAQEILKTAEENKIYLPSPQKINTERVNNIVLSNQVRKNFFENTKINRYFILNESDDLYLTQRQAECAKLFVNGFTAKQISKTIGISHRTIEGYLRDIKQKIQDGVGRVLNKDQLIQILKGSNIQ
jgi:DNA-binding CsgD family transcriptional regulator